MLIPRCQHARRLGGLPEESSPIKRPNRPCRRGCLWRMRLPPFIRNNMEAILDEWQQFAASIPSGRALDRRALRNDAQRILAAIAVDMETSQTDEEQAKKSKGLKPIRVVASLDTPAESHATSRFAEGFELEEMASEYRALRASVIRLWLASITRVDKRTLYELTRFNEGIDQALTESIARFAYRVNESRELFMGVLGHDLRTPLHVILQSVAHLKKPETPSRRHAGMVEHIEDSAERIKQMVDDLLDVTRTRLGGSLPLAPQSADVGAVCRAVVAEFEILYPGRDIQLQTQGDLNGVWDAARLTQLVSNLVRNAIQHGDAASPVTVSAISVEDSVLLKVHNFGEPIPEPLLAHIFEPLKRGISRAEKRDNLGLGLYIARTIALAHHGAIRVESSREGGTAFTVSLPRQ